MSDRMGDMFRDEMLHTRLSLEAEERIRQREDFQTHEGPGNVSPQSRAGGSPIKDPRPLNWHEAQRLEALRLFRIVQGPGDAGSEQEFNCRRVTEQAGWMRLAAEFLSSNK